MVYATISLAIVMLFSAGYKKIKQGNAIPIWGSALILCLFAGLRDISFGPDLLAYKSRYLNSIPHLSYAEILSQYRSGMIKDGLFYVIMKFFINIGASYQLFIAFITSFYVISVTVLIAKESEKPIISFLMFFTLSWFQFSFTGLRQSLAMAMCTVALTLLINNRRDVTATALIVIAGTVHSSAWIFLIAPNIARLDLKIGKCKFIVATLPKIDIFKKIGHIKIGTKYPKVAKRYFERKGMDVEIIKIEGSVELSPILGISEGIVDIMETGITLKEYGLIVVDEICDISTRVIVNKSSFKLKKKEINNFIDKIRSVSSK